MNASHKQFWDDVDRQVAERNVQLPVYRGDYGAAWDAWPTSLAADLAAWRGAARKAQVADALGAIASSLNRDWRGNHGPNTRGGLAEPDLASRPRVERPKRREHRAQRVSPEALAETKANGALDRAISAGIGELARGIPSPERPSLVAFNSLGWARTGLAWAKGLPAGSRLVRQGYWRGGPDPGGRRGWRAPRCFEARDVPSMGYRAYGVVADREPQERQSADWSQGDVWLAGPYYRVEVSPTTGGIVSLSDKVRGRELVDRGSPYHLNQCLCLSDDALDSGPGADVSTAKYYQGVYFPESGVEHTRRTRASASSRLALFFAEIVVQSTLKSTMLTTRITLTAAATESTFATSSRRSLRPRSRSWTSPSRSRCLTAASGSTGPAPLSPRARVSPGSGRPGRSPAASSTSPTPRSASPWPSSTPVCRSSSVIGPQPGPERPDTSRGTVLAVALENCIDWMECARDQGAPRASPPLHLRGHDAADDPSSLARFGWEAGVDSRLPRYHRQVGHPTCRRAQLRPGEPERRRADDP